MARRVIVIEKDQALSDEVVAVLKKSPEFTVAATYKDANAAIGQSGMFNPNLFLIDVDDKESLDMIPAFVDIFPNADILGFVSHWQANASRSMQKFKALGCISRPFTAADILDAIKLYNRRGHKGLARVIAFFSPKGRAGRTTLAAILALALAAKSGEQVSLVDADLQFGDLPIFFDIEPKQTVVDMTHDVQLLTPLNVEPYYYNIKPNLWLLSSPDRPEYAEMVDVDRMVDAVRLSCNVFRYVLIDLPAGFNPMSIGLSRLADTIVIMAMINNGFEIQHVRRAYEVFRSQSSKMKKVVYPIFTRVNPCTDEEKLKLELQLGYPIRNILPNEYRMISLANSGRLSKGLPMDSQLVKIADEITDEIIRGEW